MEKFIFNCEIENMKTILNLRAPYSKEFEKISNKLIKHLENDKKFNTNYITRKLLHYLIFNKTSLYETIIKNLS